MNPASVMLACVVILNAGSGQVTKTGDRCDTALSPASTFKIPHALVALETGMVTADTVEKWDGTRHPDQPSWDRDHTVLSAMRPSHVKTWTAGLRMEGKQSNDGTLGPLAVSYVYACHARLAQIMSDAVAMLAPHLSRSGEAAPLCRHDRATLGPIRRDAGKARCCRSAPRTCRAAAGRVMRVACLRCRFHARHRLPADVVPGRGTEDRDL